MESQREVAQEPARLKERWAEWAGTIPRPRRCTTCGGRSVWWNGWRRRSASVWVDGAVAYLADVACRRVRCAACGARWTVRPPGLVAPKHYQLDVIARAVANCGGRP